MINSGHSRDSYLQNCLTDRLIFVTAHYQIQVKAVHLAGHLNRLPDLLSRWDAEGNSKERFLDSTAGQNLKEKFIFEGLFKFTHDW